MPPGAPLQERLAWTMPRRACTRKVEGKMVASGLVDGLSTACVSLRRGAPPALSARAARHRDPSDVVGVRGDATRVARDARTRPGHLPVLGVGAHAGRAALPRHPGRQWPLDAPR